MFLNPKEIQIQISFSTYYKSYGNTNMRLVNRHISELEVKFRMNLYYYDSVMGGGRK